MIRSIALLGTAGGFMAISPHLREAAGGMALQAQSCLIAYSPYSYVAAAAAALAVMYLFARAAVTRR